MPGSGTIAESLGASGRIRGIKFRWTTDGSGNVTLTTQHAYTGEIMGLKTDPDGTDIPTDNYDITLTSSDQGSTDHLNGGGANRSSTVNQGVVATAGGMPYVLDETLSLVLVAGGNAKKGVAVVLIK